MLQTCGIPTQMFSTEIFKNAYFEEHLYLHVTFFTVHEKEAVNEA